MYFMGRDDRDANRKIQRLPEKIFSDELAHMKRHREGKKEQIETGTMAQ
jgi:hypothetical protein